MADDRRDPELQDAMDRYQQRAQPGPARMVLTLVFVVLHLLLVFGTMMLVGLSVMTTDVCAYAECGDQRWANRAVGVAFFGSVVLVVLNILVTAWRSITARPALVVAVTGCVLQVGLAAFALSLMKLAGPV